MRTLVLMTALAEAVVALVEDDAIRAERRAPGARGLAEALPGMVTAILEDARVDAIAALVGPGSFTGIRAGLALAHGLGLGWGIAPVGVTVGEALEAALGCPVLVATETGRGRVYLERAGQAWTSAIAAVEPPDAPLAGNAAEALAASLAARGIAFVLAPQALPDARAVCRAALLRQSGHLPARSALPLYVEPPEVSVPAAPPRPPPAP